MTLQGLPDPIGRTASALFGFAVKARTNCYDKGRFVTHRVDGVKIISVGNLRVGGSGKTPFSIFLASLLQEAHMKTAILLRGYLGNMEHRGGLVSLGESPLVGPAESGDEAYLAALRLKNVEIRVGKNRLAQAKAAADNGAQVIVLDDGFQHRRLHRDLDILLATPEDLDARTQLLPGGPLREPACAALRANLICGLRSDWENNKASPPKVVIEQSPSGCVRIENGELVPCGQPEGPVFLVTGISRPARVAASAKAVGINICGANTFRDHFKFNQNDLNGIIRRAIHAGADSILTTEKDLVRMLDLKIDFPLTALRIDVRIHMGADQLDKGIKTIIPS
jgi:tetraacyldisaccharide 4'-kinase